MTRAAPEEPLLEACVVSADEAEAAVRAGARRVELCADLPQGGLTPCAAEVAETVRRLAPLAATVVAMARPAPDPARPFRMDAAAARQLARDAQALLAAGAHGVVLGALTDAGDPDLDAVAPALCMARDAGREVVFHRAVDAARDPDRAVRTLLDAGFTRVLTSGAAPTACMGADRIAAWHRLAIAAGKPWFILPGGNLRAEVLTAFLRATGPRQAHGAFRTNPGAPLDPAAVAGAWRAVAAA